MTAKAEAAEVLVKLVVDSNAEKETDKLKEGLEKAEKKQKKWHSGLLEGKKIWGGVKTFALGALGAAATATMAMGGAAIGLAKGAAHAFYESEEQVRALASAMQMLDTSGTGFEKMLDIAGDLKDEMEDVAMAVGTTDDAMVAAFTNVIERGGKTIEEAKELTEVMAKAGRAIPQGVEGISEAFEQIEMGIVRAKNPIVGMIAATHLLKGNAKQVAQQMMKMSPEEQMKLAEKAVGMMAKKMDDVPLSLNEMNKSMSVFMGNLMEDAGAPIIAAIQPVFGKVRTWLMDNHELLSKTAKDFGKFMGQAIEVVSPYIDELLKVFHEIGTELQSTDGPLKDLKEVWQYIYENKDGLVSAFGEIVRFLIQGTKFSMQVIGAAMKSIGKAIDAIARMHLPGFEGGFLGRGAAASAGGRDLAEAKGIAASGALPGMRGDANKIAELREDYLQAMETAGKDRIEAGKEFDAQIAQAEQNHAAAMGAAQTYAQASLQGDAIAFAKAFDTASVMGDKATQKFVASFLADSKNLQDALITKGPGIITAGFDKLIDTLNESGQSEIAKKLQAGMGKEAVKKLDIGKATVNQTFTGSINVKQDFKDQDPERVALVFRQDLMKHALARLSPRGGIPGGS